MQRLHHPGLNQLLISRHRFGVYLYPLANKAVTEQGVSGSGQSGIHSFVLNLLAIAGRIKNPDFGAAGSWRPSRRRTSDLGGLSGEH
jgi:hypothetical protein